MKSILILFGLLLLLTVNVSAARFGSGQIAINQYFIDHFQEYILNVKNHPEYVFVYAANKEGDRNWQAWNRGNWQSATEKAIKECNKFAKKYGHSKCKVFAKGTKILWKWDQLEDELFKSNKKTISINSKDVRAIIGSGDISLTRLVENSYKNILQEMNEFNDNSKNYFFHFAVSNDGSEFGISTGTVPKNNSNKKKFDNSLKKEAVSSCMIRNNAKQCYLYASHEGILWKF